VAKELLNDIVYPAQEDYREAAEKYLKREQPDFIDNLSRKRWLTYYEKYLHQEVSKVKHNSSKYFVVIKYILLAPKTI
jgi:hypothetical protein